MLHLVLPNIEKNCIRIESLFLTMQWIIFYVGGLGINKKNNLFNQILCLKIRRHKYENKNQSLLKLWKQLGKFFAGATPPNHKNAIGVTKSGVAGVDIPVKAYSWSESHFFNDSVVTDIYKQTLSNLTGNVNDATFAQHVLCAIIWACI